MTKKYDHKFDDIPVIDSRDPDRPGAMPPVTHLRVEVCYSKGWAGYARGWRLHIQPFYHTGNGWACMPRDGVYHLAHSATRASMRGRDIAVRAAEAVMPEVVQFCLDRNPHLRVVDVAEEVA